MNTLADRSYRWLFWCLALVGFALDQGSKYSVFNALHPAPGHFAGNSNPQASTSSDFPLISGAFSLHTQYLNQRHPDGSTMSWLRNMNGELRPYVNTGALFGLGGAKMPDSTADGGPALKGNTFFALVSIGAALAIIFWVSRGQTARDRFLCLALGLILAGTLGNLFDRLVFHGVRDFFYWNYLVDWPVFNFADCCLVCGAGLLLVQAFLSHPEHAEPGTTAGVHEPQIAEAK